jgi:hypothetical protein
MEVTKWLKPSVWLDQSNLLFSRSTNVQLVRLGALAERYFHDDPNRGALQTRHVNNSMLQPVALRTTTCAMVDCRP